jgi:signal transduction histidine kinase
MKTLRARVLLGAVLWTVGLVAAVGIAYPWYVTRGRSARPIHVIAIVHSPGMAFHTFALLAAAIACMILGLSVVKKAFSPLDALRSRLAEVRRGKESSIGGRYPAEVQPLIDDLNALLAHGERTVARAVAKAGDLAHGLKTPLAVLSAEAEGLAAGGQEESARIVSEQVSRMRRQIDYQLAQTRAAAAGSPLRDRASAAAAADGLVRTLRRLHSGRNLEIRSAVESGAFFRGRIEDLEEMLGNLMDNACRWASSRVAIECAVSGSRLVVTVDDDGPGLAAALRETVLRRGFRADETGPGSGLGLAIVRDLAELHGGSIALEDSPAGGLRARLDLPAIPAGDAA